MFINLSAYLSFLYTVTYMVMKLASPPITFEIGSDRNTPATPKPSLGRIMASGTAIIAFLKSEKNIACFE